MSTRYVWGRYNIAYEKTKRDIPGSGTNTVMFSTPYYTIIADEADMIGDSWDTGTYESYNDVVKIPAGKCFDFVNQPTGVQRFDFYTTASFRPVTAPYGDSGAIAIFIPSSSAMRLVRVQVKGTANGTVSNASSGAYQLDTSVESLL